MTALFWALAQLALGVVVAVVLLSCVAVVAAYTAQQGRRSTQPRRELCDHGMWRPCRDCGDETRLATR